MPVLTPRERILGAQPRWGPQTHPLAVTHRGRRRRPCHRELPLAPGTKGRRESPGSVSSCPGSPPQATPAPGSQPQGSLGQSLAPAKGTNLGSPARGTGGRCSVGPVPAAAPLGVLQPGQAHRIRNANRRESALPGWTYSPRSKPTCSPSPPGSRNVGCWGGGGRRIILYPKTRFADVGNFLSNTTC